MILSTAEQVAIKEYLKEYLKENLSFSIERVHAKRGDGSWVELKLFFDDEEIHSLTVSDDI